ncbi:PQQ-binding-like beta-propeller repeat protein [Catellatospora bangladeshensis]|uniref:Pyrrolo-quinoline quinone repeat domain-containing protein n=1 Tax=Catellatospora bangladeshensis TaxID=310355 RepID=A0A8J3JFG1_9ACTN|nr:PQQ-binding-like beta-propeller repeat protein [Catellatospora bangladeshensis]GIF79651.1 hypothetical protein Cba03nite_10000 [Catellatospora bangladeshensis]
MTAAPGAVIDLGADWAAPADPAPAEPRRWGTRLAVGLALAALLGTAAADTLPPGPRLVELARWHEPGAVVAAAGPDTFLVAASGEISAYDATDGHRLWRAPGGAFDWTAAVAGDVQLIAFTLPETVTDPPLIGYDDVLAVDRRSGVVRWRNTAALEPVGGVLVSRTGDLGLPEVTVHDPVTFAVRWRAPAALAAEADPWAGALWRLTVHGDLVEHDLVSGAVRRSVRLPGTPDEGAAILPTRHAVGLTGQRWDGRAGPVAVRSWYDRQRLAPVAGENRWARETDCGGGLLCALPAEEGAAFLIDAATGEPVRALPGDMFLTSPGGPVVVDRANAVLTARLDPATGARVADVAGWEPLATRNVHVRFAARTDSPTRSTYLAELTPDGLRRLGRVPGVVLRCDVLPGLLACTTVGDDVVLWRVAEA